MPAMIATVHNYNTQHFGILFQTIKFNYIRRVFLKFPQTHLHKYTFYYCKTFLSVNGIKKRMLLYMYKKINIYADSRPCPFDGDFRCNDDICIRSLYVCDGYDTCSDGSDEINCGK